MAKKTDVNFDYIPKKRYIVEIEDKQTGRKLFSERISGRYTAELMKEKFNALKDFTARILDTKTGEVI